jgi:hypothetical protein
MFASPFFSPHHVGEKVPLLFGGARPPQDILTIAGEPLLHGGFVGVAGGILGDRHRLDGLAYPRLAGVLWCLAVTGRAGAGALLAPSVGRLIQGGTALRREADESGFGLLGLGQKLSEDRVAPRVRKRGGAPQHPKGDDKDQQAVCDFHGRYSSGMAMA